MKIVVDDGRMRVVVYDETIKSEHSTIPIQNILRAIGELIKATDKDESKKTKDTNEAS